MLRVIAFVLIVLFCVTADAVEVHKVAPSFDFEHKTNYTKDEKAKLDEIHKLLNIRYFNLDKLIDLVLELDWMPPEWLLERAISLIDINTKLSSLERLKKYVKSDKLEFYIMHAMLEQGKISLSDEATLKNFRNNWERLDFRFEDERYFFNKYVKKLEFINQKIKIERNLLNKNLTRAEFLINNYNGASRALQRFRLRVARDPHNFHNILIKNDKSQENDELANYFYTRYLLRKGKNDEAYKRLLRIKPVFSQDKWWRIYYNAAREAVLEKRYKVALDIASHVYMKGSINHEEQLWFMGWVKLNFLNDFKGAAADFAAAHSKALYSMSKSRAAFWLQLAHKRLGDDEAMSSWHNKTCEYYSRFYGQLDPCDQLNIDKASRIVDISMADKKVMDLVKYYVSRGEYIRSYQLTNKVQSYFKSKYPSDTIAKFYSKDDILFPGVMISKHLTNRGATIKDYGFPVLDFNASKQFKILYHGIIRQESEFNYIAKSHAGAYGLMQLMPATAKYIAKKIKIPSNSYAQQPRVNLRSGIYYFDEMMKKYDNLVLAICAYNAGPGNVNRWLKKYGDFRKLDTLLDQLNWIEQIPFGETRMYVKKVLENAYIYGYVLDYKVDNLQSFF